MKLLAGTSGYSYKEWKGAFYPPNIKPAQMLSHYAKRLPTVEINATFYRMPKRDVIANWARQVPPDFRFSIKASRRISHHKPLADEGELLGYLFDVLEALGDVLGCVLFQLPPHLRSNHELLGRFLDRLPAQTPCAFEFRHPSWFDEKTFRLLRDANAALVRSDSDEAPLATLTSTADWGYLRLRRSAYGDDALRRWRDLIQSQPWSRAYLYFKHEDEAAGPAMAARFLELGGAAGDRRRDPNAA